MSCTRTLRELREKLVYSLSAGFDVNLSALDKAELVDLVGRGHSAYCGDCRAVANDTASMKEMPDLVRR
jgi:hypothetical protein